MLNNPFWLGPADEKVFVGRQDLLDKWRQRLKPDTDAQRSVKYWLVIAEGGMGKSSLLYKLRQVAQEEHRAHTVYLDFGFYRDCDNPAAFFETFNNQISQADDLGTKVRKLLQLPPDSSAGKVWLKSIGDSLKIAGLGITFSPLISLSPTLPDTLVNKPEDIAVCYSVVFSSLRAVAERGELVVVLVDQLGKAHDSPLWCNIASLLLSNLLILRNEGLSEKLIFVLAFRPERYGLLDARIQQPQLLSDYLFERKYLKPFDEGETREAIQRRGGAYTTPNIISGIINELERNDRFDPYIVVQAASAVWVYLYGGERQRSPANMTPAEIRKAITSFYGDLTRHFKQYPPRWEVVKLLALYKGGLTADEIVQRLQRSKHRGSLKTHITRNEAEVILQLLLENKDYQVISKESLFAGNPRYFIAHELLREAINSQTPEDQQEIEQASKTLMDSIERCQKHQDYLTDKELFILWQHRNNLRISIKDWGTIAKSILENWNPDYIYWLDSSNLGLSEAILCIIPIEENREILVRGYVILHILNKSAKFLTYAFKEISRDQNLKSYHFMYQNIPGLIAAGYSEELRDLLSSLSRNCEDSKIRIEATNGLGQLGELGREVLDELVSSSDDEWVLLKASDGMVKLGELQKALDVLVDLADRSIDEWVLCEIAKDMVKLGESKRALDVLAKLVTRCGNERVLEEAVNILVELREDARDVLASLAWQSRFEEIRRQSVVGLAELGKPAWVELSKLADCDHDDVIRLTAAEGLMRLGETPQALIVLHQLARGSRGEIRIQAIEMLKEMKELARQALADLTYNNDDEVCVTAALALIENGEVSLPRNVLIELVCRGSDESVLYAAAEGLLKIGEQEQAREVLKNLIAKSDKEICIKAAGKLAALGYIGLSCEALKDIALLDEDKLMRRLAVRELARLGVIAKDMLSELVYHSTDYRVRRCAIEELVNMGEPAQNILTDLAWANDDDVRVIASIGLIELGGARLAREILVNLVRGCDDGYVLLTAAEGLAKIGETQIAIDILANLARRDPIIFPADKAIDRLLQLGEIQIVRNVLTNRARTSIDRVDQDRAAQVLANLGDKMTVYSIALSNPLGPMANWFFLDFSGGNHSISSDDDTHITYTLL